MARGHSRETTFQRDIVEPADIEAAVTTLAGQVLDDVAREGRPVVRLTLKIRYAPFFTQTRSRKLPAATSDRDEVVAAALGLAGRIEPGRPIRLLGLHAEMTVPPEVEEESRSPVRGARY